MAILVETMSEYNWRTGRNFSYVYTGNNLAEGDVVNLAFCTGDQDVCLTEVELKGSSSILTWNWFSNSTLDRSSVETEDEIKLNQNVNTSSGSLFLVNPTIQDFGVKRFKNPIDSLGVDASAGRVRLEEKILTKNLTLPKNTNNIIQLWNRHVGSCNIEANVSFFRIPDFILNDSKGDNIKDIF